MLTRPLALLAYAHLCAVEAAHERRSLSRIWLLAEAVVARKNAEQLGTTDHDWARMWEWLAGREGSAC